MALCSMLRSLPCCCTQVFWLAMFDRCCSTNGLNKLYKGLIIMLKNFLIHMYMYQPFLELKSIPYPKKFWLNTFLPILVVIARFPNVVQKSCFLFEFLYNMRPVGISTVKALLEWEASMINFNKMLADFIRKYCYYFIIVNLSFSIICDCFWPLKWSDCQDVSRLKSTKFDHSENAQIKWDCKYDV